MEVIKITELDINIKNTVWIEEFIRIRELTQAEFCRQIGIKPKHLSRLIDVGYIIDIQTGQIYSPRKYTFPI